MTRLSDPKSVVKVGDGRGFVVKHRVRIPSLPSLPIDATKVQRRFIEHRLVVTAAHCLPKLPPAQATSFTRELTWGLLGTLDGRKTDIFVECLFVNPVADIAVLGRPDDLSEEFFEDSIVYDKLIEAVRPLLIGEESSGPGWVLSLDRKWIQTTLKVIDGPAGRTLEIDSTEPGMSGSPILNNAGRAVAVVAVGAESSGARTKLRCGPQPILKRDLPVWFLRP